MIVVFISDSDDMAESATPLIDGAVKAVENCCSTEPYGNCSKNYFKKYFKNTK